MKIKDYGNIIIIQSKSGNKEFHLPAQKTEGLNYLFELLQNASLEQDTIGYIDDDFIVKISRHGIVKLHSAMSLIIGDHWVETIFSALND